MKILALFIVLAIFGVGFRHWQVNANRAQHAFVFSRSILAEAGTAEKKLHSLRQHGFSCADVLDAARGGAPSGRYARASALMSCYLGPRFAIGFSDEVQASFTVDAQGTASDAQVTIYHYRLLRMRKEGGLLHVKT